MNFLLECPIHKIPLIYNKTWCLKYDFFQYGNHFTDVVIEISFNLKEINFVCWPFKNQTKIFFLDTSTLTLPFLPDFLNINNFEDKVRKLLPFI